MASEDKTYCGQSDRSHVDATDLSAMEDLCKKLGVSKQDILDAIEQVGNDRDKVEEYFHDKENSY